VRASEDAHTALERAREKRRQAIDEQASSGLPTGDGTASDDNIGPYGAGCRAFTANLRRVNWPTKFRPDLPEKYDGIIDLEEFLQIYTTAIQAAGGGPQVMANYFHVALRGTA
jgi:hypothetical protein